MDSKFRVLPPEHLLSTGLLFEINRAVLHKFGLALAYTTDDTDASKPAYLSILKVDDPEGLIFGEDLRSSGYRKYKDFLNEETPKLACRLGTFGWLDQPGNVVTKIEQFTGEYRWLSNFFDVEVVLDGVTYSSTEHAYQAAKTLDPIERERVRLAPTHGASKREGRKITLRPGWDSIKNDVMLDLLRQKFARPDLRRLLDETGETQLVEGNHWHDVWFGVCSGKCRSPHAKPEGANHLGRMLMQVRDENRK
jgi:ribA/ribD-fused uncharacterized protein